jgi:hypothetical protein
MHLSPHEVQMYGQMVFKYLPWVLSICTLYMTYLAGTGDVRTWRVGILTQVLWIVWVIGSQTWGMLPMSIGLSALYARNHILWKRQQTQKNI